MLFSPYHIEPDRLARADSLIVMKTVLAAIYTTFETWIIDDEGIEQPDEILAPPTGDKLILGFKYSR